ncbi:MAG TPA: tyrosine--tRNA ligase [Candidatus Paceibacterota bacterium]|nr:tyrosine--tRNA ligase [Candidatus Paceibacterota bacterium]
MNLKEKEERIQEVLTRSISKIYPTSEKFAELLHSNRPLRIYMGIDPTATYVHLGHATNYLLLRRLHQLGHKIIVLVGDFTAMIGDPSDKKAARQRLTKDEVKKNLKDFKKLIGKILDFKDKKNPVEFVLNSKWLSKLNFNDLVELASNFTVQQMLERDNFEKRLKEQKPLYVHEFFYPLMQGYDSIALDADIEIGGTDQTFNMLAGRTLLQAYKQKEKIVVTTTLLENPVTGEKLMSKSLGTGIGLDESPASMFGKTMALPDEAIIQCFVDCTDLPLAEIENIKKELHAGANPRDLKMRLAWEIVKLYHGDKEADKARNFFVTAFQKKEIPADIKIIKTTKGALLMDILLKNNLVKSKSDFRRLVAGGGLSEINGEKITEPTAKIEKDITLKIGKKNFLKIELK